MLSNAKPGSLCMAWSNSPGYMLLLGGWAGPASGTDTQGASLTAMSGCSSADPWSSCSAELLHGMLSVSRVRSLLQARGLSAGLSWRAPCRAPWVMSSSSTLLLIPLQSGTSRAVSSSRPIPRSAWCRWAVATAIQLPSPALSQQTAHQSCRQISVICGAEALLCSDPPSRQQQKRDVHQLSDAG